MRPDLQPDLPAVFPYHPKHRRGSQRGSSDLIRLGDRPKDSSARDSGGRRPTIQRLLDPCRDGDGTDAAVLAAEVDEHPAAVALLDVFDRERGGFGAAAQPATAEKGQDDAIALAFARSRVRSVQELLALRLGQPVPCSGALLLDAGTAVMPPQIS